MQQGEERRLDKSRGSGAKWARTGPCSGQVSIWTPGMHRRA